HSLLFLVPPPPPPPPLFPYTTLFRSLGDVLRRVLGEALHVHHARAELAPLPVRLPEVELGHLPARELQHELVGARFQDSGKVRRSEEHTSELQSLRHLVCRLLLEKKK